MPAPAATEAALRRRRMRRPPRLARSRLGFQLARMPAPLLAVLRALAAVGNRTIEDHHRKYCQSNHLFPDAPAQWNMVALGDPPAARERAAASGAASASFNAWKTGRGAGGADGALAVRDWIAAVLRQTLEDWQGRSAPLALVNYYGLREYGAGAMMVNHRDDARVWWGGRRGSLSESLERTR